MLKIITVCGLGMGSSLILKMTVQSVLKELDIKADVEHWDMGTIKSKTADIIITTTGFKRNFEGQDNVIYVKNIVDKKELKQELEAFLNR